MWVEEQKYGVDSYYIKPNRLYKIIPHKAKSDKSALFLYMIKVEMGNCHFYSGNKYYKMYCDSNLFSRHFAKVFVYK